VEAESEIRDSAHLWCSALYCEGWFLV